MKSLTWSSVCFYKLKKFPSLKRQKFTKKKKRKAPLQKEIQEQQQPLI